MPRSSKVLEREREDGRSGQAEHQSGWWAWWEMGGLWSNEVVGLTLSHTMNLRAKIFFGPKFGELEGTFFNETLEIT